MAEAGSGDYLRQHDDEMTKAFKYCLQIIVMRAEDIEKAKEKSADPFQVCWTHI